MTKGGFKRGMVFGVAAVALALGSGCREQPRSVAEQPQYVPSQDVSGTGGAGQAAPGQQPLDISPQQDQEGFKTVPPQQTLPSGIQKDQGQGGSGMQAPVDVNPVPGQEGFKTVPPQQKLPSGVGTDTQAEPLHGD